MIRRAKPFGRKDKQDKRCSAHIIVPKAWKNCQVEVTLIGSPHEGKAISWKNITEHITNMTVTRKEVEQMIETAIKDAKSGY